MDIISAMAAIESAIKTMGKLRKAAKGMEQAELKTLIADLANDLADAKIEMATLKIQVASLEEENRALKSKKETKRPEVYWGCYRFEGDSNLYCPACFDREGKKFLTTRVDTKSRRCSNCQAVLGS